MSPSPRSRHQLAATALTHLLRDFVITNRLGRVIAAPMDVHLPSGDVVQPDVLFILERNEGIIQDWIRGVPDLVVEVVSPEGTERDRIIKKHLYARNSVPEYWILDCEEMTVEVFCLRTSDYSPQGYFGRAGRVVSPLLPGLSIAVHDIFA